MSFAGIVFGDDGIFGIIGGAMAGDFVAKGVGAAKTIVANLFIVNHDLQMSALLDGFLGSDTNVNSGVSGGFDNGRLALPVWAGLKNVIINCDFWQVGAPGPVG